MKTELDETAQMLDIASGYIVKAINDGALQNCVTSPVFVLKKIDKLLVRIGYNREFKGCVPTEKEELISMLKTLCDLTSTEDLPRQIRNASHEARLLLAKLETEG